MASFSLTAHILGTEYSVSAQDDGTGWVVTSRTGRHAAGRFQTALRISRDEIGKFLRGVRRGQLWGLVVQAGDTSAIYGTPNPAAGVVAQWRARRSQQLGRADPAALARRRQPVERS